MNQSSSMQPPTSNLFEECEQYHSLVKNVTKRVLQCCSFSIHGKNYTYQFYYCKSCVCIDWFFFSPAAPHFKNMYFGPNFELQFFSFRCMWKVFIWKFAKQQILQIEQVATLLCLESAHSCKSWSITELIFWACFLENSIFLFFPCGLNPAVNLCMHRSVCCMHSIFPGWIWMRDQVFCNSPVLLGTVDVVREPSV